jgi:hypothetical protein
MEGVRHEDVIHGRKTEARAPQIPQDLSNCDSVILVRNSLQRSLVKIDGMNRAAGS